VCQGCRRPGCPDREGGTREGIESGSGESRAISLIREVAEVLVQKIALLMGELAKECWA
jgi:hypothetical protein